MRSKLKKAQKPAGADESFTHRTKAVFDKAKRKGAKVASGAKRKLQVGLGTTRTALPPRPGAQLTHHRRRRL